MRVAHWQSELESLLSQLHVTSTTAARADEGVSHTRDALPSEGVAHDDLDGSVPWELGALTTEDAPPDGVEVSAVRSEIEATIEQVMALVQSGRVEGAFQDDVVFVLRALTRPHPPFVTSEAWRADGAGEDHAEWHLASAAAVLRFCRIVQRLLREVAEEDVL